MIRRILFLIVLCVMLFTAFAAAREPARERAAVAAAEKWLALVDAGKYGQSWQEAAGYFRNAVSREKWAQSLRAVRSPLGNLVSRKVKGTTYTTAVPGAPDGEYVVVLFETSFGNKKSAVETVTPMREKDGKWRVSGYYIK